MRRAAFCLLLTTLAPLPALSADACRAEYERGFSEGVAAVNAQLGAVTAQMQRDVQAQVNAQLAALDARRNAELEARLAAAQGEALAAQGPVQARGEGGVAVMPAMPTLPPLVRAPGGGIAPARPDGTLPGAAATADMAARGGAGLPDDPAALPAGTTITISDPQALPPELYRALVAFTR